MKLQGKTALVLGGAKGIGKAIGFALAKGGATVVLTHHDWPEEAAAMRDELAALGGDHLAIKVDLRDPAAIQELFATIQTRYGGLHILINNIERGGMPIVHGHYTPEQWELEMATTLRAKWWVMRSALPLLCENPEAAVITLSSIAGIVGRCGPAGLIFNDGYSAANRAISSFTETWAREGAPNVRVNELMLGFFETRHAEQTRGWGLLSAEQQAAIREHILLKRTGKIEEIIAAVFFLLQDATYMTGSVLRMDGGYVLGGEKIPPMPNEVKG
ncbi:MAG: SDR family oxidoreductase [Deltaproteobacteria bacterium]|jgi:3-oxoacyl-[acyl-carrier protein] reductase|uniref:SDR family NAD(P)-dependent oxidoreductase n=1 Tax=Hydrosulfovibrio ferrireducens TaxID=2934181 RepID=UPI00120154E1|nr:MAG: SDR family oxidoreductase [Deltaproteobacteria bacterium]